MSYFSQFVDKNNKRIFCLTGDGEIQEGSVWESAMAAANYKLDNFCWILDNNDCQIDGRVKDVMSIYPIAQKFDAFGFHTINIDGHDFGQIIDAFDEFAENHRKGIRKPTVIIAKTLMGKDVSLMQDKYIWHGNPPNAEQAENALEDLK